MTRASIREVRKAKVGPRDYYATAFILKQYPGADILPEFVKREDVLVKISHDGTLGFGIEDVRETSPGLVYRTISASFKMASGNLMASQAITTE